MDELGIGAGVEDIGKRDFPQLEKRIAAGGCNVPFGEPWPSNIPRYSLLNKESKTFVIGLGHKAQSGKNTLAKHLIEKLGPRPEGTFGPYFPIDIREYAFANELKIEVFDFFQNLRFLIKEKFVDNKWWGENSSLHVLPQPLIGDLGSFPTQFEPKQKVNWIDRHKLELRSILQKWGTEFRRAQDPDYWVKKTLERIKEEKPQVALITDLRFLNETAICDTQIQVVRPGFSSGVQGHVSETELDTFPYPWTVVGENVEDLKRKGFDLVEGLLKKQGIL